jgi:hypothetical protein
MYTASQLINQSRKIAELQNTKNISFDEEIQAINEAYRDVYNRYTESNGDYFVSETIISMDGTNQVANSNGWWYYLPLPADFYKLRAVSFNSGGMWYNVESFAISDMNVPSSLPQYRLRNNFLWIICTNQYQIKIDYYIPPESITSPDVSLELNAGYNPTTNLLVTSPTYLGEQNSVLYIYNSVEIHIDALDGVDTLLLTTGNAKAHVQFYKGYIYWIELGDVWRAPAGFLSTILVPVKITTLTGVVRLSVFNDKIYYRNGADTYNANLDGSGSAVAYAGVLFEAMTRYLGLPAWILTGNGQLYLNNVIVPGVTGFTSLASDNSYLYLSGSAGILYRYLITGVIVTETVQIGTNVSTFEQFVYSNYLAIKYSDVNNTINVLSVLPDTQLDYPSTEVNEILAYSAALFYVRKATDDKKMMVITSRLAELWERFNTVNMRDEYQVYRINSHYAQNGSLLGRGV